MASLRGHHQNLPDEVERLSEWRTTLLRESYSLRHVAVVLTQVGRANQIRQGGRWRLDHRIA